jgi:hypothetical protein
MTNRCFNRRWRAAIFIALVSLGGVLHAEDVVRLHVSPTLGEKDDLTIQIRLTRSPDNQFMKVVAASSSYYGSTEMVLDGQGTEPLKIVTFRSLPAGWYEVIGAVYDANYHMRGSARTAVLVYARGPN